MDSVPLLEHFAILQTERELRYQQRYEAQNLAVSAALSAAKEAVAKAEIATEKRFESVNEFRAALTDQTKNQVSILQFDALKDALSERLQALISRLDRIESRATGFASSWVYLLGVIGLIQAVMTVYIIITHGTK